MEVYTRHKCDNQECEQGRIKTGNAKLPWEHCGNCEGTGYITEWIDLDELIKEITR